MTDRNDGNEAFDVPPTCKAPGTDLDLRRAGGERDDEALDGAGVDPVVDRVEPPVGGDVRRGRPR